MIHKAKKYTLLLALSLISTFPLTSQSLPCNQNISKEEIEQKPLVVFIHGTLFSAYRWLVHWLDCPLGFAPATKQGNKYFLGRIPYILHEAAPEAFPLDSFYLFGWSGSLNFEARKKAAHQLYHELKKHKRPITVIAQSHGCNVALNLAQIAQEHKDTEFIIDRLVLLACPVQEHNAHCVKSHLFKQVFSLYSTNDIMQCLDPQGIYKKTKELLKSGNKKIPFFSQRTFEPASNLTQARIILNGSGPAHVDFILKKFLIHLQTILKELEAATHASRMQREETHYTVTINKNTNAYTIIKNKDNQA